MLVSRITKSPTTRATEVFYINIVLPTGPLSEKKAQVHYPIGNSYPFFRACFPCVSSLLTCDFKALCPEPINQPEWHQVRTPIPFLGRVAWARHFLEGLRTYFGLGTADSSSHGVILLFD